VVLHLAELSWIPQVRGPGQKGDRVDRHGQLGVSDDLAGAISKGEQRKRQAARDDPELSLDPFVDAAD
jgi:hypothetical protein